MNEIEKQLMLKWMEQIEDAIHPIVFRNNTRSRQCLEKAEEIRKMFDNPFVQRGNYPEGIGA